MKKSKLPFRENFQQLEKITKELETSDVLELEKGIAMFEKGMQLAQICKTHLQEIENTILNIQHKYQSLDNEKNT